MPSTVNSYQTEAMKMMMLSINITVIRRVSKLRSFRTTSEQRLTHIKSLVATQIRRENGTIKGQTGKVLNDYI